MPITLNGVQNLLNENDIPDGYSRPNVITFTDVKYIRTLLLTVLKTVVDNADATVTMLNIIENATIGLEKQITDILANDYDATGTVSAYADWTIINNNFAVVNGNAVYLTDDVPEYQCTLTLYVKTA